MKKSRVCVTGVAAFMLLMCCTDVTVQGNPPVAPSGLTATATSATAIRLEWTDNSSDETGFKIERSPDGSAGWTQVYLAAADAVAWDDSELSAETAYYYRVCATNDAGDSEYSNTANATTIAAAVPVAPSGLTATATSATAIHLAWTDNSSDETGFKIERSPDGSAGWTQAALTAENATTWDDTGLASGTVYYYRVDAVNSAGDSAPSSTTHTSTFFTPMVAINAAGDTFTMGDGSYGPNVSEGISYGYNMSTYQVTNALFAAFIADGGYGTESYWTANGWAWKVSTGNTQPALWTDGNYNGSNQPVVGVSWYEAVAFCNWRSTKEGLTPAYGSTGQASLSATGYRLPTEAEWEYAAAKGGSGQSERIYAWGDTFDDSHDYAVTSVYTTYSKTADVGSLPAGNTPQGLVDMSGNVDEMCSDTYQAVESVESATDRYYFVDDTTTRTVTVRGGNWSQTAAQCVRCAFRNGTSIIQRLASYGFRVMRR